MAACRISCHYHPSSSSMAVVSTRSGARKAAFRLNTAAHGINSSPHLSFTAERNKEMFEDQLRGIVCYKDEKGDMICEGYDEGPRLGVRLAEKACFPWPVGVQVTDFIHMATLQVFEDADDLPLKG